MNWYVRSVSAAALVAALGGFGSQPVLADWNEGQGHKMHYPQRPDLGLTGIDVNATRGQDAQFLLADDFRCAASGPITNVHIWGSWLNDAFDQAAVFTLSLHADIPTNEQQTFSMPGALLKAWTFAPAQYRVREYHTGAEGWMDPPSQYISPVGGPQPPDTVCFQYNFAIDLQNSFTQRMDTVYWLDVQAFSPAGSKFGWKTCVTNDHWNDDAVWMTGDGQGPPNWQSLVYPPGHPFAGRTLDFAFVVDGAMTGGPVMPDFGDAPEGGIAYPDTGTIGQFPTCMTVGPAAWIQHAVGLALFGQNPVAWDGENDGNAGICSSPPCFPPYDQDECFNDGDAGLIKPPSYTIGPLGQAVVSCNGATGSLGRVCTTAQWGPNVDIWVINNFADMAYVNVLMDWDRNGQWGGASQCPGAAAPAPEHVLVNFPVPPGFNGPLSALQPPPFLIGPNAGYVWSRFTISDLPVQTPWEGEGSFSFGETEDYLLAVDPEATVVPVRAAKWVQPPDCNIGVDIESWAVASQGQILPGAGAVVADDWLCDGRPITGVRWWGSYLGWQNQNPATNVPPPWAQRPVGFRLTWYTDVPAQDGQFSRPGFVLATNYYPLWTDLTNEPPQPGVVVEQSYCVSRLTFLRPPVFEHEYVYYVTFPDDRIWNEKEGRIYWLSAEAVYQNVPPEINHWGWKTAPPKFNWNDDAVRIAGAATNKMVYPPPGWETATNHPYLGQSVNMSFTLYTDVSPRRCKKWIQRPDMNLGVNMASWRWQSEKPQRVWLRADDFLSDGRPITDIHWWGSYIGWRVREAGDESRPVAAPSAPPYRPLGFKLSWHASGAEECLPGAAITNLFVPMSECHEVYYGTVTQWWEGPGRYEHEYQYYVDLLNPDVSGGPWREAADVHYWLDIQAVFTNSFVPEPEIHQGWGWKISGDPINACVSPVSTNGGAEWHKEALSPPHPNQGQFYDLAFELTCTEIPNTNAEWQSEVRFMNIQATAAADQATMWTTGYCGCGRLVLQESTNLLQVWRDIQTNELPLSVNTWTRSPLSTKRFYRVQQRD